MWLLAPSSVSTNEILQESKLGEQNLPVPFLLAAQKVTFLLTTLLIKWVAFSKELKWASLQLSQVARPW